MGKKIIVNKDSHVMSMRRVMIMARYDVILDQLG